MKLKGLFWGMVIGFGIMPCKSQTETDSTNNWINPLAELIGVNIYPDTTFSFHATDSLPFSPIEVLLPDSLVGTEVHGYAKVFVHFTAQGSLSSISLHSYELRCKKKVRERYHRYMDEKNGGEFYEMLEHYLTIRVSELPIRKTLDKLEEGQIYTGCCYLIF